MPTLMTPMMTTTMTHNRQSMIAQAHYQMSQKSIKMSTKSYTVNYVTNMTYIPFLLEGYSLI